MTRRINIVPNDAGVSLYFQTTRTTPPSVYINTASLSHRHRSMMLYNTCKQNHVFEEPRDQSIIPLLSNVVSAVRNLTGCKENIFKVGSLHNITMHGKDSWIVV